MPRHTPWTAEMLDKVRSLHADGRTYTEIAVEVGVAFDTIKRQLVPGYGERRNEAIKRARQAREGREVQQRTRPVVSAGTVLVPSEDDARRVLASIPPDTRGLTARLCGDPLRGRSALDQRAQG